jgi:general stress protein 26
VGQKADDLRTKILELLDEHRVMAVATVRTDGWPQTTMVGYIHDELTLYFAVARASQKMANIERDGRVSIALGHEEPTRLRGLSMAAHAEPVTDGAEIDRVNELMRERYHELAVFSPRETSSALLRASPMVVSLIDLGKGPGEPELVSVADPGLTRRIKTRDLRTGATRQVLVHTVRSYGGGFRPGEPP